MSNKKRLAARLDELENEIHALILVARDQGASAELQRLRHLQVLAAIRGELAALR